MTPVPGPLLGSLKSALYRTHWFSRRRQSSLVVRLLSLAYLWGLLVYLLAVGGVWWTANHLIRDNLHRQSLQWLRKLDNFGAPLLISRDPLLFETIRAHVANSPEIAFLRYLAPDGKTELACYLAPGIDPQLFPPFAAEELQQLRQLDQPEPQPLLREISSQAFMRISAPAIVKALTSDGLLDFSLLKAPAEQANIIGFVDIGLDFRYVRETLGRNLLYGSALILVLLLCATFTGRLIILRALRPLSNLQIPLARLARGETDIQVESADTIEIAAIGNALNSTITAIKERDRELHRLAIYDSLTGLYNRYSFNRELELEKARILLEGGTSALLFLDLDRFKEVNDTVGHAAGDDLLVQVAQCLRTTVRSYDVVSRLGGDEFTIILKEVSEDQAALIAEEVCASLRKLIFSCEGFNFTVQCSIGVTLIDSRQTTPEALLSQADAACHDAKKLGRNRFRLYRQALEDSPDKLPGENFRKQLTLAVQERNFALAFQPVVECRGQRQLSGYEGLLRMNNGDEELPAGAFIRTAERFELVVEIDRIAIELAVRELASGRLGGLFLSVNLAAPTLLWGELTEFVRETVQRYDIPAQQLVFEIPERALLENITQTRSFLTEVRELGCRVAIDDFGISLNTINVLKSLTVDQVKVDGTLINGILSTPFDRALLASILNITGELGIEVVAKEVCRVEEARELNKLGCTLMQGQFCGAPLPELPAVAGQPPAYAPAAQT